MHGSKPSQFQDPNPQDSFESDFGEGYHTRRETVQPKNKWSWLSSLCWHKTQEADTVPIPQLRSPSLVASLLEQASRAMKAHLGTFDPLLRNCSPSRLSSVVTSRRWNPTNLILNLRIGKKSRRLAGMVRSDGIQQTSTSYSALSLEIIWILRQSARSSRVGVVRSSCSWIQWRTDDFRWKNELPDRLDNSLF